MPTNLNLAHFAPILETAVSGYSRSCRLPRWSLIESEVDKGSIHRPAQLADTYWTSCTRLEKIDLLYGWRLVACFQPAKRSETKSVLFGAFPLILLTVKCSAPFAAVPKCIFGISQTSLSPFSIVPSL
jgi:hypothetical protein